MTEQVNLKREIMAARIKHEEHSIGDLLTDFSREISTLIRQEMELARIETTRKASILARRSALFTSGLALAFAGLLGLIAAAIYGLGTVLPWWASSLIIGGGVFILGLALAQMGRSSLKRADLKPHHTVESLKEDIQWAKRQAR